MMLSLIACKAKTKEEPYIPYGSYIVGQGDLIHYNNPKYGVSLTYSSKTWDTSTGETGISISRRGGHFVTSIEIKLGDEAKAEQNHVYDSFSLGMDPREWEKPQKPHHKISTGTLIVEGVAQFQYTESIPLDQSHLRPEDRFCINQIALYNEVPVPVFIDIYPRYGACGEDVEGQKEVARLKAEALEVIKTLRFGNK